LNKQNSSNPSFYEAEVAAGLEQVAFQELCHLGTSMQLLQPLGLNSGVIDFRYRGDSQRLLQLSTVLNIYAGLHYAIPRPKAILAQANFSRLLQSIQQVLQLFPKRFRTFGISAAGSDSPVLQQLQQQLADALGIPFSATEVDLLVRLRPARLQTEGWEVLLRLTPRPLSVRDWRVADMKGALNAAVAHSMVLLTQPKAGDKYLNLACGSGTLLIERLMAAPARRVIGCDTNPDALQAAQANLLASRVQIAVELHDWDARATNLPDASIDAICADLPFGINVGDHTGNVELYPQILAEAARVAKPRGRFVLMTQEITLMDQLLEASTEWKILDCLKITLRGLHPRIYVLQRKAA